MMGGTALGGTTMAAMRDWARSLVVLVLLGSCLDLVLPQNGYRGYVRMVLSLLLVLAMLGPILALTGQDQSQALTEAMAAMDHPKARATEGAAVAEQATRLRAVQETQARKTVQQRLATEAVQAALMVPGVASARAEVSLVAAAPAEGTEQAAPAVEWVRVTVVPGVTGAVAPVAPVTPVLVQPAVGDSAEAPRNPGLLSGAVRQAVAVRLGVPPGSVHVLESAAGTPAAGR